MLPSSYTSAWNIYLAKLQEAEVEKQLREAGGKLSEHGALLLNRGLLLLKLCFNQGISKAGNKSLGVEISLVLKGKNNPQDDDNG